MGDPNTSIISLGELSKPATVLIEKISDAIGGIFAPYQIERKAKAEAKAEKIQAISRIGITKLQRRALGRLLNEESAKQKNIESITQKALPLLKSTSKPKDLDRDWIVNFFEKARLISNNDMQNFWSRILAGEANIPGSFSKRTLDLVHLLDKRDASLFSSLASFVWTSRRELIPIIIDAHGKIYNDRKINFESLKHLDSIGLISFDSLAGYTLIDLAKTIQLSYRNSVVRITFANEEKNKLNVGLALLTSTGKELVGVCDPQNIQGLIDYVIEKWNHEGNKAELIVS